MSDIQKISKSIFEKLKRLNDQGQEYWSSRELVKVLGYSEYRHFLPVVEKAKESCKNSGQKIPNHFEDMLDMVQIGSGIERELDSIHLYKFALSDILHF